MLSFFEVVLTVVWVSCLLIVAGMLIGLGMKLVGL